jgi:hypothetical protein
MAREGDRLVRWTPPWVTHARSQAGGKALAAIPGRMAELGAKGGKASGAARRAKAEARKKREEAARKKP